MSTVRSDRARTIPPLPLSQISSTSPTTGLPTPTPTPTPTTTSTPPSSSTHTSSAPAPAPPHIKPELDPLTALPLDRVEVYIGNPSRCFQLSESALLAHSPKGLYAYIQRPAGRVPRIMDPDLMGVEPGDFEALAEWAGSGEFAPVWVYVHGEEGLEGSGRLEGVDTAAEAEMQVGRLGRLYVLALRFGVVGMQSLVLKKLKAGFPGGWDTKAMLGMVGRVLEEVPGHVEDAAVLIGEGRAEEKKRDPLKAWLVQWLGRPENVELITTGERKTARLYWDTLNRAVGLRLAVSREGARAVERWKGVRVEVGEE